MILTEKTSEIKHPQLTADEGGFRMKVPVLQADAPPNLNKRVYPFEVVKRAVADLKVKLQKRSAFGSTRHEKDLELDQVSHYVEDISLDDKGLASAVLRILGTTKGRNLTSILRGGGSLGVSARGEGSVVEGVVQADFKLLGVDFCLNPSFAFHVNREAMFESAPEVDENDGAVSLVELEKMGLTDEGIGNLTENVLKAKYRFALECGYKGSLEEYSRIASSK